MLQIKETSEHVCEMTLVPESLQQLDSNMMIK